MKLFNFYDRTIYLYLFGTFICQQNRKRSVSCPWWLTTLKNSKYIKSLYKIKNHKNHNNNNQNGVVKSVKKDNKAAYIMPTTYLMMSCQDGWLQVGL